MREKLRALRAAARSAATRAALEKLFAEARAARERWLRLAERVANEARSSSGRSRRAAGTVRLPGSKSISNRVLLLAALAQGETDVRGLLDADDTRVMLRGACEARHRHRQGSRRSS